jgi:hypothetical protein
MLRYLEQNSDDENIKQRAAALDIAVTKIHDKKKKKNIEEYMTPIE